VKLNYHQEMALPGFAVNADRSDQQEQASALHVGSILTPQKTNQDRSDSAIKKCDLKNLQRYTFVLKLVPHQNKPENLNKKL